MKRSWMVLAAQHEQPDPGTWDQLVRVVDEWNRWDGPRIDTSVDFLRMGSFDEQQSAAFERLLRRMQAVPGAELKVVESTHLEQVDYAAADLVGVFGTNPTDGFVVHEPEALRQTGPCPVCGQVDAFDMEQSLPLVIDEAHLDEQGPDAAAPGVAGWDLLTLPHGGLAASTRLVEAWLAAGITGLVVSDLIDSASGLPSTRVRQVSAQRTVVPPCAVHTRSEGAPHCPRCGLARSSPAGPVFVRRAQVGADDVVAMHRSPHSLLFLTARAYALTLELAPTGLQPHAVRSICQH